MASLFRSRVTSLQIGGGGGGGGVVAVVVGRYVA